MRYNELILEGILHMIYQNNDQLKGKKVNYNNYLDPQVQLWQ